MLRNVAAAYAIKNEKKYYFQMLAYQKAADVIESSPTEVKELIHEGKIESLQGVGPAIRKHLEELIKNSSVKHFESITNDIPQAVFPLLDIPSFGPKKAYKLVERFKFQNPDTVIDDLKREAEQGNVATIDGFGKKSEDLILQAISEYEAGVKKKCEDGPSLRQ